MDQSDRVEETARRRLRTLRQARSWTLDDLAARAHVGAWTSCWGSAPVPAGTRCSTPLSAPGAR